VDWYLYNARGVKTPGGDYLWPTGGEPARVRMYLQQYAKKDARGDVSGILKTLAHEGAHHIWRTKLNEREQAFWADLVTQRAPIDYDAILAATETANPAQFTSLVPLLPTIKAANPVLYLQILIASSKYDPDYWKKESGTGWAYFDPSKGDPKPLFHYTIPEIEALRDKQEAMHVPVFPITGYGATNPEEAFCDAVGLYVAYGPGAVLEPVREILFRLAPQVRRNPASDSTADT
jgi:hypothetical protein